MEPNGTKRGVMTAWIIERMPTHRLVRSVGRRNGLGAAADDRQSRLADVLAVPTGSRDDGALQTSGEPR